MRERGVVVRGWIGVREGWVMRKRKVEVIEDGEGWEREEKGWEEGEERKGKGANG